MANFQFHHSIKVPRLYKEVTKVIKKVNDGGNLKSMIANANHPNKKGLAALAMKTLQHNPIIRKLFEDSNILADEERIDETLAAVLITELLWGKKDLKGDCKPIQTILKYKDIFLKKLSDPEITHMQVNAINTVWRPRYVRINTLISSTEQVLNIFKKSWNLLPTPDDYLSYIQLLRKELKHPNFIRDIHIKDLLAFPFGTMFYDHPLYHNGTLLLQDKASCMATYILAPEPGSNVLDMCAAPGMKTSHLAAYMDNYGTIYAVEKVESRYEKLKELLALSKVTCVQPIHSDVLKLSSNTLSNIEYILLDAPCSGSGMLKSIDLDYGNTLKISQKEIMAFSKYQKRMLIYALTKFPTAKRVVYCTCSVFPEENEYVVKSVLSNRSNNFKLASCGKFFSGWLNFGLPQFNFGHECIRSVPSEDNTNGFFIAAFERISS